MNCGKCKQLPYMFLTNSGKLLCERCCGKDNPQAHGIKQSIDEGVQLSGLISRLATKLRDTKLYKIHSFLITELDQLNQRIDQLVGAVKFMDPQSVSLLVKQLRGEDLWQPPNKITLEMNRLFRVVQAKDKKIGELEKELAHFRHQVIGLRAVSSKNALADSLRKIGNRSLVVQSAARVSATKLGALRGSSARSARSQAKPFVLELKKSDSEAPEAVLKFRKSTSAQEISEGLAELRAKCPGVSRLTLYIKEYKNAGELAQSLEQGVQGLQGLNSLLVNNFYRSCNGVQFESMKEFRLVVGKFKEGHLLGREWV